MKSWKPLLFIAPLAALLILILAVSTASAHRPDWGGGETTYIDNIQVSYAFYRSLNSGNQVDSYIFHAVDSQFLHAGIQIPRIRGLETYTVSMALFGPGLPAADEAVHALLPANHPEDQGVLFVPSVDSAGYFEPFTQTSYAGRQQINQNLPGAGDYTLLVWQPEGRSGKYVLDVGQREQFGPLDFFLFPVWWVRVRLYFEQGSYLLVALISIALVLLILLRRRLQAARDRR
jgi:hypothetical protein